MSNQTSLVHKILKNIWIAVAILIIFAAVFSSIFRTLTPWAKQYKGEVERRLSSLVHQTVSINSMEIGWYWFEPVLKLNDLTIKNSNKQTIQLKKLLIGVNVFKSLFHWQILPGILYADGMHLRANQKPQGWEIEGIETSSSANQQSSLQKTQELIGWLSQQDKVILKNVSIGMQCNNKQFIAIQTLNLSIANSGGFYKIKGDARLQNPSNTYFQLLGSVYWNPAKPSETKGQLYASAQHLKNAQWQNIIPQSYQMLKAGEGDLSLWLDLNEGTASQVQAQIAFNNMVWRTPYNNNNQKIKKLNANLSWKPTKEGWQFNADSIKVATTDSVWPENQFSLIHDKKQQSYQLFAKKILINSLLSQPIHWPAALQKVLVLKAKGTLTDTQLTVKENELFYLVTRFDRLSWQAKGSLPQVRNLSGVLNWQPEEGRLELDTEKATLEAHNYPKIDNLLVNGAIDWKELSHGMRISIERLVLSQPQFTLSMRGAIDEATKESVGMIRLATDFSGKNIQQWLPYLPKSHLKPKLYEWIVNNIKRMDDLSGTMEVAGMGQDFPFDNNNGTFAINAHVSGADLLINSQWQLIKNIEAFVKVNKRNLNVDMVHANAQGVPVKQLNLRIDDIGHDKENLLIHTIITGGAQKIVNFVLASPLKEKLSILKKITVDGLFALDLRVEVPLYTDKEEILAQGALNFKDNNILIKHQLVELPLQDVAGTLAFNEQGVLASSLVATGFSYPWHIKIQSLKEPTPITTVAVEGQWSVESLKSRINLPVLALLKGAFNLNSVLKITKNPDDFDNLNIKSSLQGLAINLPAPLGKAINDSVPLELNLDFNAKNTVRLKANYNGRLSTDIVFQEKNNLVDINSGEIRLGSANAKAQDTPGLALVGNLEGFDLQAWKSVIEKYSIKQADTSLLRFIQKIDLTFGKLTFLKQQFDKLSVKAKILANNDFAFSVQQEKIAADLTYQRQSNTLSGFVHYLHLTKFEADENKAATAIKPEQIPNLNLRIDDLEIGALRVGDVTLKSRSSANQLKIDYCRVNSPVYQFDIKGNWLLNDAVNQSQVQLKMHLTDLAKSLDRWQISPVVFADKGDMEFNGGWHGSIYNFSLPSLYGSMFLQLKNGRITHLSPETEEKLGLGKLLSVLSLQTIPRRLTLDFSDLSHQGYSFDVFKGNFIIKKGIMNTQDSYIDGPVAYASMKGDLNLVRKMYDMDLIISPHITASLPIVATIAGGPIVGIAAWVANKIINQSMQKITSYTYKISGPWKQPIVHQLTIVKKVEKK